MPVQGAPAGLPGFGDRGRDLRLRLRQGFLLIVGGSLVLVVLLALWLGEDAAKGAAVRQVLAELDASGTSCFNLSTAELLPLASSVAGDAVLSKLQACHLLHALMPRRTSARPRWRAREWEDELRRARREAPTEHRLYLRDRARADMRATSAMCRHHFGGDRESVRYVGAGAYGIVFARCAGVTGFGKTCRSGLHAIVKLAGLYDTFRAGDAKAKAATPISARSHRRGRDASVEGFYSHAMARLVARRVMPHAAMLYGTWMCDNFTDPRKPSLLPPALDCAASDAAEEAAAAGRRGAGRGDGDGQERKDTCENIQDELVNGMSPNMQVLMLEMAEGSLHEVLAAMRKRFRGGRVWLTAVRAFFFQIVYAVATLQSVFGATFRHNDLSPSNVRSTLPPWAEGNGTMHAPLGPGDAALTHWVYTLNGTRYRLPNHGFHARITDFDFSHSELSRRTSNDKVAEAKSTRSCSRELSAASLWGAGIELAHVDLPSGRDLERAAEQIAAIQEAQERAGAGAGAGGAGPRYVGQLYLVNVTVGASGVPPEPLATDRVQYRDPMGHGCREWAARDCGTARAVFNFSAPQQRALLARCPRSCRGRSARMLGGSYLVRLGNVAFAAPSRAAGAWSRPLRARPVQRNATHWVLGVEISASMLLVLRRRALAERERAAPRRASQGHGSMQMFRQEWFQVSRIAKATADRDNPDLVARAELHATAATARACPRQHHVVALHDPLRAGPTELLVLETPPAARAPRAAPPPGRGVRFKFDAKPILYPQRVRNESWLVQFGFVIRRPSSHKFWQFALHGIIPTPNRRYDLHFLFGEMLHGDSYRRLLPPPAVDWLKSLFAGNQALRPRTGSLTYESRMSDALQCQYCERGDAGLSDDDAFVRSFPTPAQIIRGPFFAELGEGARKQVQGTGGSRLLEEFDGDATEDVLATLSNGALYEA